MSTDPAREREALVKKMQTPPFDPTQIRKTSYDVFTEFAGELRGDLDETLEKNQQLSKELWDAA